MMKKLSITKQQWVNLEIMINTLYLQQEVTARYADGTLTLRCNHCLKITHIHWYELLYDHILVTIAKRLHSPDWIFEYVKFHNEISYKRIGPNAVHPLDYVYSMYFLPHAKELARQTTANKSKSNYHLAH